MSWALDISDHGWLVPGRLAVLRNGAVTGAAGRPRETDKDFHALLSADGLDQLEEWCAVLDGGWVVALYRPDHARPGRPREFHFFREDREGGWSHKPGDLRPAKVDGTLSEEWTDPIEHEVYRFVSWWRYDPMVPANAVPAWDL